MKSTMKSTMESAMEIKTRTPPDLPDRKQRIKDLVQFLMQYTTEELKKYFSLFSAVKAKNFNKREMAMGLAAAFSFENEAAFREWFFKLPVLTQNLLYRLAFDWYVPVKSLESEFGLSLVHAVSDYSWRKKWAFHEKLGLKFLKVLNYYEEAFAVLPYVVRKILTDWLAAPPELSLENCAADSADSSGSAWENSAGIVASLPLLYDAMEELFRHMKPPDSPYRRIRGFKKKEAEKLRASSALKPFDVPASEAKAADLVPDSADLTARFLLSMHNMSITRPKDSLDALKTLVNAFFGEKSLYSGYVNPPDRHSLEYNVLFDHVSKTSDYFLKYEGDLPRSRRIFLDTLLFCARDGRTFDADKVSRQIYRTVQDFSFYYDNIARYLKYRADKIITDEQTYSVPRYDEFYPNGGLEYYLLIAPLFKAYCYLFAVLGLLEITQISPPLRRIQNEKKRPLSPYDSLKTFRVTEFGKWCLALTKKRPEPPKTEYQAIADKELLLVTVQGDSLERSIYLDRIGRRLGSQADSGTDRWRISPDSFIEGCSDKTQIEERVIKFKALIDPKPAPHWLALFDKVMNRAGLFDASLDDMLVYRLPADRDLAEELLQDRELRSLVHRAEGGLIVAPEKNRKKFFEALKRHGIAVFEND
ncbi:hypothetical protein LQZ21_11610 [Treponema sp. TIM-1]|uniref:hypothetical protein n=1 Tax=Treponema sp. TIM-1 TaxID=2898417 RepID=UPI003980616E